MIISTQVTLVQGTTSDDAAQDREFGYVAGENGGFFFTWMDTLNGTLDTIEEDEQDGDGGLSKSDVKEYLETYLPTTHRASDWSFND